MNRKVLLAALAGMALGLLAAGCERKEKVLDVEAPGIDIEIERSTSDGSLDIKVDDKIE